MLPHSGNMSSVPIYSNTSNSATGMPNCSLATSEVKRPWWTKFSSIDKLPSTFPRSSPCSMPSARPRSRPRSKPCSTPSALAVSKAQSCANNACSSRLRCSLNIFLSSSDQLLQSSSWSAWLMARSGCWVKGLFPKNSNHGLRTSSLLVSLYLLDLIYDSLSATPQTQRLTCPVADSQPPKSEDLDEPYLGRQKISLPPQLFPRHSPVLTKLALRAYVVG